MADGDIVATSPDRPLAMQVADPAPMTRLDLLILGPPRLRLDGRDVDLRLKKGVALLVYLAEAAAPVSRDTLAALLWPDFDGTAARAGLRRTLHRIHAALGGDIVEADRAQLRLSSAADIAVDARAFEHACDRGDFPLAIGLYRGDYLSGFTLPDCETFEEWAFFRREALRGRLIQALERLGTDQIADGAHLASVASAARLVEIDPLSETAHRLLIRAHIAAGDRAAARHQYERCARILSDELGVAPEPETQALLDEAEPGVAARPGPTRYAAGAGVHLAYRTMGEGPPDLILVPGFVSHVERVWEEPRARAFLAGLSQIGRLILFDRRGVGLSDRVGSAPTIAATSADIGAVMEAAGSRRAILIGSSEGGPGCIKFAVDAPDRLAGLVLYGSLAKGSRSPDYPFALSREQYAVWLDRLVAHWGAAAEIKTFAPSLADDRRARAWWAGLLRAASSPGALRAVLEALRDTDVRDLLPWVSTPTLVVHRRGDRALRIGGGRHLAEHIPGARLVELDGEDHWFFAGDQRAVLREIAAFAAGLGQGDQAARP